MLAPPFIVTEEELDDLVTRFATALDRTLSTLAAGVA
jgi:adenosylmethionine-8-amino-7-oxononanoate aminotransferase